MNQKSNISQLYHVSGVITLLSVKPHLESNPDAIMNQSRRIYCCNCKSDMDCSMLSGREIYPHLPHLYSKSFWRCSSCKQHVGCHKGTTNPLGCIPTPRIKEARRHIHDLIDPLWKYGKVKRGRIYRMLSNELGYEYHTAEIRSLDEARKVYTVAKQIIKKLEIE